MSYTQPEQAHVCRCKSTGAFPFFCPTGHMLECHYPLDCRQAACGHMSKYEDLTPADTDAMEQHAKHLLRDLADQDCGTCEGTGRTQVSSSIILGGEEFSFKTWAICPCVPRGLGALDFSQTQNPAC